jgi:hypothetical protein
MLIATAAACAVGIATSVAQVYSVNAVGYVNVNVNEKPAVATTLLLVANPLNAGGNTLAEVFPALPDLTLFFPFNNGTGLFDGPYTYFGGWDIPTAVFAPGSGGFLAFDNSIIDGSVTITFVGEVPQGTLSTTIASNRLSIVASKVPQGGQIDTALGFPAADLDLVFTWNKAQWKYNDASTYLGDWDIPPVVGVAEAFVVVPDATTFERTWTRVFNVNNP